MYAKIIELAGTAKTYINTWATDDTVTDLTAETVAAGDPKRYQVSACDPNTSPATQASNCESAAKWLGTQATARNTGSKKSVGAVEARTQVTGSTFLAEWSFTQ